MRYPKVSLFNLFALPTLAYFGLPLQAGAAEYSAEKLAQMYLNTRWRCADSRQITFKSDLTSRQLQIDFNSDGSFEMLLRNITPPAVYGGNTIAALTGNWRIQIIPAAYITQGPVGAKLLLEEFEPETTTYRPSAIFEGCTISSWL